MMSAHDSAQVPPGIRAFLTAAKLPAASAMALPAPAPAPTVDLRDPSYSTKVMTELGIRDRGSTVGNPYESGAGFEALREEQESAFWRQQ